MQKKTELNKTSLFKYIITALILNILSVALFIFLFSVIMYFLDSGLDYSNIYATVAVAIGSLISSFYLGRKLTQKGFLIGLINGITVFTVITVISLIIDKDGLTFNTLFRLIIFVLASLIGGVSGVNKKENNKYI